MDSQTFEIQERTLDPVLVGGIPMTGYYSDCGKGFGQLGRRLGRRIAGKPLCLFYDGGYRGGDANFEPCMPLKEHAEYAGNAFEGIAIRELPGGRCLSLMHLGPYEKLRESYDRLRDYVAQHNFKVQLPTREVYHKGPGMFFKGNPHKYLTEIQFLLAD